MHRIACFAVASMFVLLGTFAPASPGSWTAPLTFQTITSPEGEFLAAEFDLGVRLREIDSVRVTFTLPDGYTPSSPPFGMTNGTIQLSTLVLALDEPLAGAADASRVGAALAAQQFALIDQEAPLTRGLGSVPAGQPIEVDVPIRLIGVVGDICRLTDPAICEPAPLQLLPDPEWPEALFDGVGVLAMGESRSQTLPVEMTLPLRPPVSAVVDASITVAGVAVPEPSSAVAAGCLILFARLRRKSDAV